jgi:hypothetical protein
MRKFYVKYLPLFAAGLFLILFIASCKKDRNTPPPNNGPAATGTIGLYELDSAIYKRVFIPIAKVGTQTINMLSVFDTGSTGMTIDAAGLLPASMITANGLVVPGDSVVVNGITVTADQATVSFGGNGNITHEYGNVAYATVILGSQNGMVSTGRIPIFIYYKVVKSNGQQLPAHANDVFGVGPGLSFASNLIGSPLSYIKTGNGVASGFKLAMFNSAAFNTQPTYVPGLLTIGLLPQDLNSDGFIMHPLLPGPLGGDSPNISATVTYNGKAVQATALFDTGTPAISLIEDPGGNNGLTLAANSVVTISTPGGFNYQYVTSATDNLTQIDNPNFTGDPRSIFSIDFFIHNEYLLDYTHHQLGLKNN